MFHMRLKYCCCADEACIYYNKVNLLMVSALHASSMTLGIEMSVSGFLCNYDIYGLTTIIPMTLIILGLFL